MGRDFLDSRLMGESFFMLFRPGWKNAKEPGAYSLTLQKIHYPMPPLCFFALTCAALAQGFGTQNKFCAPKPQPGEAEDGAKSWREGSSPTSGCRFRRTPTRVPTAAQCFRETIPQSASPAPGWRVSAANLKGRQNLQPGEAEDGAKSWREGSSPTSGCRFRRTPTRVPTAAQCFRETIPQSASPAPGWRVSAANLKGRQNLFCAPEPQPGEAEDGAQTHKGAFGQGSLWRRSLVLIRPTQLRGKPVAADRPSNGLAAYRIRGANLRF